MAEPLASQGAFAWCAETDLRASPSQNKIKMINDYAAFSPLFHATIAHLYLPYTSTGSFCVFLCLSVVYLIVLNFVVFSYVVQLIVAQTRKKNHFSIIST